MDHEKRRNTVQVVNQIHGVAKSQTRLKRLGSGSSSIALGQQLGLVSYSSGKRIKVEK